MTFMGRDWTHSGVAKLYTDICRNGYRIMYLTSRAIGQAGSTRHYLKGINQDSYQLPEGPVIMSPDRLLTSLHRCENASVMPRGSCMLTKFSEKSSCADRRCSRWLVCKIFAASLAATIHSTQALATG